MEHDVVERFAKASIGAERVSFARRTYTFEYPTSPVELLDAFRTYYGPTMNAYAAAEASGLGDVLHKELEELFISQNTTGGDRLDVHSGDISAGHRRGMSR